MIDKFIKDYYYELFNTQDTSGRRRLTQQVNALLDTVPPKALAMALVTLVNANTGMFDAEELNQ